MKNHLADSSKTYCGNEAATRPGGGARRLQLTCNLFGKCGRLAHGALHDFPVTLHAADEQENLKAPPQRPVEMRMPRDDGVQPSGQVPRNLLAHEDIERVVVVE